MPPDLGPLQQFIEVTDDFDLHVRGIRSRPRSAEAERATVERVLVFWSLCRRGVLQEGLPYVPSVRDPPYVLDFQRGMESQFV